MSWALEMVENYYDAWQNDRDKLSEFVVVQDTIHAFPRKGRFASSVPM